MKPRWYTINNVSAELSVSVFFAWLAELFTSRIGVISRKTLIFNITARSSNLEGLRSLVCGVELLATTENSTQFPAVYTSRMIWVWFLTLSWTWKPERVLEEKSSPILFILSSLENLLEGIEFSLGEQFKTTGSMYRGPRKEIKVKIE